MRGIGGKKEWERLTEGVEFIARWGRAPVHVEGLTSDSRAVEVGWVFVARRGVHVDGHDYIEEAVTRGARVVVCSCAPDELENKNRRVHYVQVAESEEVYGVLCARFFGNPSHYLRLVGVTGTNGKTSVVRFLHQLMLIMGYKAGVLSTINCQINEEVVPSSGMTTPDALEINYMLRKMVDAGCSYAFMEVSSHASQQQRVAGLQFAGGVFTNLGRDHLDYHGSLTAYRDAKKAFFDKLPAGSFMLFNADDKHGEYMAQNTEAKVRSFSSSRASDYQVQCLCEELEGMQLKVHGQGVWVCLHGMFNVENVAAVYGVAMELGFVQSSVLRGLSLLTPVEGRFQVIMGPGRRVGVVDFAHTPSALESVLRTARKLASTKHRVITVFGAGGDRDRGKRKEMGHVVAQGSHWLMITSDNPRSESPQAIIEAIYEGVPSAVRGRTLREVDRRKAIQGACMLSRPRDIILVAGKGHEKSQELVDGTVHFDDVEELKRAFALLQGVSDVEQNEPLTGDTVLHETEEE